MDAQPRETATLERLQHVPAVAIEDIPGGPDTARQRVQADPLTVLYRTGALGKGDTALKLYTAGARLHEHYRLGNLDPLGSIDYAVPHVGSSGGSVGSIFPASQRQLMHRQRYRAAVAALGHDLIETVTRMIVLDEDSAEDVGRAVTGRASRPACIAVAVEFLKLGLERLDKHFDRRG